MKPPSGACSPGPEWFPASAEGSKLAALVLPTVQPQQWGSGGSRPPEGLDGPGGVAGRVLHASKGGARRVLLPTADRPGARPLPPPAKDHFHIMDKPVYHSAS